MSFLASLFGKEILIGVDIGSAYLKAVQVEASREGFRVVRAAQQKTPPGTIRDGVVQNAEALAGALRQMFKAAGMSATGAVMSIAGPTVMVRQVQMPTMPESVLKKSIRYEAGKFISSSVEDSNLAFEILGPVEDDPGLMNVMLVAAPREMVQSRVAAMEQAGLEAAVIDLESFALLRALVECNWGRYNDGAMRALVDIGASHTEVTIVLGTRFQLTRSLPIAGDTFTDAIKNQMRLDAAEAEKRKMELDMSVLIHGTDDPTALEAPRAIQSIVDELLREVRRSINYYQSQLPEGTPQHPLSEIVLAGGSSLMGGLAPYVTARLGVDVRVGNAFENPAIDAPPESAAWLAEQAPRLGTALGLAVKEHMHASAASIK